MVFKKLLKYALLAFVAYAAEEDDFEDDAQNIVNSKYGLIHLTHHTFTPTLLAKPDMPFVVFVYADWCGHCTRFKPEFNRIVEKNIQNIKAEKIGFAMYNYDSPKSNQRVAGLIGCDSFPCMLVYHRGRTSHFSCKDNVSKKRNKLEEIVATEIGASPDCDGKNLNPDYKYEQVNESNTDPKKGLIHLDHTNFR